MKELSIFVDESGDFGDYDYHTPFYIISMVLHDQSINIFEDLKRFELALRETEWGDHCVHAGPIIRGENEYENFDVPNRRKLLMLITALAKKLDVEFKSFYIEKKHINDPIEATGKLGKQLYDFLRGNYEFFLSFDSIKVYYDNGQVEVTKILSSMFTALLENVEFRRVKPSEYRLFQIADLVCTLKLAELKMDAHILSNSELLFFRADRDLKKNYIKPIRKKEFFR